jgi:P27 family predicted phage terminase small subunit
MSNRYGGGKPGPKPRKPFGRAILAADEPGLKSTAPACPAQLTEKQKTIFRTTVAELAATPGWLQPADRATLMAFAIHTSNCRIAQRHVDQEGAVVSGKDGPKISPWAIQAQKESSLALAFSDRLGLSPASRQTLRLEPPRPEGLPDPLMPPRSHFEHVKLERTLSTLTETVFQELDAPDAPGLFDTVVEVQPDPVVPLVIEADVPILPVAGSGPPEVPLEAVQLQGEAVATTESDKKAKKTVNWPFPRFDR